MADFMSLTEAAARLAAAGRDVEAAGPKIVETACKMIAGKARSVIGTYDYGWPPLKPSTAARKANGDTPLLETGELRDSIEWTAEGNVGHVGSNDDKAVWQELGTSRGIPPRSFLMMSAINQGPEIAKMARQVIAAAFAGHGSFASRVELIFEALKLLHEAADKVSEHWDNFTEDTQHGRRR